MPQIKVLLVDDHTLFHQAVGSLLSRNSDIEVLCGVSNGGDAVDKCVELRPNVVLIDISMPGLVSFEAARQIKKARPETKVLFLSMHDDEDYLRQALECGANGYLLKDTAGEQLIIAVREIARGGSHLSPRMLAHLVDDFRGRVKGPSQVARFGTLTTRERDVLKMLAEGKTVKEIACDFNLSTKTIEAHKFNLMRKLDIHNKTQLVHYAIQKKIILIPNLANKPSTDLVAEASGEHAAKE
jgi:two-component system, NarL family, response regulator NreC